MRNSWLIFLVALTAIVVFTQGGGCKSKSKKKPPDVINPVPTDLASDVSLTANLNWDDSKRADGYYVFMGTSPTPGYAGNTATSSYDPGALAQDTTYYWNVIAYNSKGNSVPTTWSFKTILNPPSTVTGPTPADSATGVSILANLSWNNSALTDGYYISFGTTASPPYVTTQTSLAYDPGTLLHDTSYYWEIVAYNASGNSTVSTWSFRTVVAPPTTAVGPMPALGAADVTVNSTFSWTTVSTADGYYVFFGTTASPSYIATTATPTYDPGTLAFDTTYYWNVIAYNAGGNASSTDWSFKSIVAAPSAAASPSPSDNATDMAITSALTWSNVSDADGYYVFFGTSASPSYVATTSTPDYDPGMLSYVTTYYWKVIAYNVGGNASAVTWSFSTQLMPLVVTVFDDFTGVEISGADVSTTSIGPVSTNASGMAVLMVSTNTNTITITALGRETTTVSGFQGLQPTIRLARVIDYAGMIVADVNVIGLNASDNGSGGFVFGMSAMEIIGMGWFNVNGSTTVPNPVAFNVIPGLPLAISVGVMGAQYKLGYSLQPAGITVNGTSIDVTITAIDFGNSQQIQFLNGNLAVPSFTGYAANESNMMVFGKTSSGMLMIGGGDYHLSNGTYDSGIPFIDNVTSYHILFNLDCEDIAIEVSGHWSGTWAEVASLSLAPDEPVTFFDIVNLTSPSNTSVATGGMLSWDAMAGANMFAVKVVRAATGDTYRAIIPGSATGFTIPAEWNLIPGQVYLWQVFAIELANPGGTDFSVATYKFDSKRISSSYRWLFVMP